VGGNHLIADMGDDLTLGCGLIRGFSAAASQHERAKSHCGSRMIKTRRNSHVSYSAAPDHGCSINNDYWRVER
jgi:hypothetical protein